MSYAIIVTFAMSDNAEVMMISDNLQSIRQAEKLLEQIDEFGYYEEMNNPEKIVQILNKVQELGCSFNRFDLEDYFPEIEHIQVWNYEDETIG